VQWIERAGNVVQHCRPIGRELLEHQALSQCGIAQPGEAVVSLPHVGPTCILQLTCEPLPTVDADLDAEREPRLDAGIHEPEARVYVVLVQVQALASQAKGPWSLVLGPWS